MSGKVILIGAGPGDPLLITLRGKQYIGQADCIVYDRLASSELLAYARSDCELIYVGKENHHHTMKQDDINGLLAKKAGEYNMVVRLKGGDPYVFGRGGEEALYLKERQVEVEVVPGISSVIATLTDAGIPITHRGLSKGFQVVTAHSKRDEMADIDYAGLLDDSVTYLFLMGLSHTEEIANGLMAAGKPADTPAAVISNGTTARQKKVVGNLSNIYQMVLDAGLVSPAIIVVGNVVTLAGSLDFFESRPLFGRKYIVPYIERFCFSYDKGIIPVKRQGHFDSELEQELREQGAEICSVKVGAIVPVEVPEAAFFNSFKSDWIVFTSRNGVNTFLWNLKKRGLDIRAVSNARIACVGKKTAEALEKAALQADLIPEIQNSRELYRSLIDEIESSGNTVNTGHSDEASGVVRVTLFGAGGADEEPGGYLGGKCSFEKLVCYENAANDDFAGEDGENRCKSYDKADWSDFDGIIFTSGSSVRRFVKLSEGVLPDKIYSIGPTCSEAIKEETDRPFEEAETASYKGLLQLINGNRQMDM